MDNRHLSPRKQDGLLAVIASIPAGYVATHGAIARHLTLDQRHVATMIASFDEAERQTVPWWRVVAEGGAVGRHPLRSEQMAKLAADGVPLSAAGIVQELADRRIADLASPPTQPCAPIARTPAGVPARSRGMKSHAATAPVAPTKKT